MSKRVLLFDHAPELRSEWCYIRNIGVDPETLTKGVNRKFWWVCKNFPTHIWDDSVDHRATGRSCPFCAGKRILIGFNDLESQFPDIAKQMVDTTLTPTTVTPKSGKKADWMCSLGHVWRAVVSDRTGGHGCPACSGKGVASGFNDISTKAPWLIPEIFDGTDPTSVSYRSHKSVSWICFQEHVWVASINNRYRGDGCPVCIGRKIVAGVNDLATINPKLATELYDTTISATELSANSGRLVDWRCGLGHIWTASVNNRARGTGCPECTTAHTSKIEGRLRNLMASSGKFGDVCVKENYKLPVVWGGNSSMRVDIFCLTDPTSIVVEYDGQYFHKDKGAKDLEKTRALLEAGYLVIRVREGSLPHLPLDHPSLLQLTVPYSYSDDNLNKAIDSMLLWIR